jgi:hypothetical protein
LGRPAPRAALTAHEQREPVLEATGAAESFPKNGAGNNNDDLTRDNGNYSEFHI